MLDVIGIQWPNIDEDAIKDVADECRQIGSDLESGHGDAEAEIEQMLSLNSSQALTIFQALWSKLSKGHMQTFGEALKALADVLDVIVGVIIAMKTEAVVQLGILAVQLIADQAAAIETLGASEAEAVTATAVCKMLVKKLIDEAVQQVEHELLMAVAGPLLQSLESAGAELATQLLGDAVGVSHGIDMSKVASAGESGFNRGMSTLKSQAQGAAEDPLGAGKSLADGSGLPSETQGIETTADTGGGSSASGAEEGVETEQHSRIGDLLSGAER